MIGSSAHRHRTTSVISARTIYYPQVEFTIYLDRKPLYYIVNIIVPVFFLVLVVLMVRLLIANTRIFSVAMCISAMSHLRFCRAILSRDFDARQSRSVQLHSRTLRL